MTYRNRELIREPLCMLRASKEEREKLTRLAERVSNGGAVAPTLLDLLLKMADDEAVAERYVHGANATQRSRVDTNPFGALMRA